MKRPPLLLAFALIFWGLMTGNIVIALLAALLVEAPRLTQRRWEFSQKDFKRIWDLSTVIVIILALYLFVSNSSRAGLFTLFHWMPLIFLPIVGAELYSTVGRIRLDSLFFLLRKRGDDTTVDLSYPYFILCVLSAGIANQRTIWFYVGLSLLTAFALWFERSRRFSPLIWASLLAVVILTAYLGQMGLHTLQGTLEQNIIARLSGGNSNPYKTTTSMGAIGQLKQSGAIRLRVKSVGLRPAPKLLMETSYNVYNSASWLTTRGVFAPITTEASSSNWPLNNLKPVGKGIIISTYLKGGSGILPLPLDASRIEELPAATVERNAMGAVKVEGGPGFVSYRVQRGEGLPSNAPPTKADLSMPKKEKETIKKIAKELGLYDKSPEEALGIVAAYLSKSFRYSLYLTGGDKGFTPLSDFLLRSRSGHCEYFATATVLLLREAGLNARYAVGYSVQEYSESEEVFIVRDRHAHAWALVHIDGRWTNFDTTPPSWYSIEKQGAHAWEPLTDLFSRGFLFVSKLRWSEKQEGGSRFIYAIIVLIAVVLAWRLFFRKSLTPKTKDKKKRARVVAQNGIDSDFYLIEKRLKELGYERHHSEPTSQWIKRIGKGTFGKELTDDIPSLLDLHYRYRFDPSGLSDEDRTGLKRGVEAWLSVQKGRKGAEVGAVGTNRSK